MPDTFGEPLAHPLLHNPTSTDTDILPIHVARHRQNQERERRNSLAEKGVELGEIQKPKSKEIQQTQTNVKITSSGDDHLSWSETEEEEEPLVLEKEEEPQMKRKGNNISKSRSPARPDLTIKTNQNGSANGHANGKMNHIEQRRKHVSLDVDSPSARSQLMDHNEFSLDNEPPTPKTPAMATTSFSDLPMQDKQNFLLLCLLYFLQGIPMGLASGSVPFLLKNYLSYGQIGVFSLAAYPYSLKLLWSPIVDAVWSRRFGRRKSWITPIQMISGLALIYLGSRIDNMMADAGKDAGAGVWSFTGWWFLLVFLCATQDIAVDGWAISLLSIQNISYASTAQTVGLTAGQFLSHTVFLAFNAPDFTNRWFRTTPKDYGLMTLGGYMTFWGWAYLLVTLGLAVLKREEKNREKDSIMEVYRQMWAVLKLKNIGIIIIIHLIAKIGFVTNDAVTNLKLLDKGFGQANMALVVLIDFPFEISLGYYAGKWSTQYTPLRLWCWAFVARLAAAVFAQSTIMIYPAAGVTTWYMIIVIAEHIYSTFMSTIMFVAVSAFHARIADPAIGGTYMTLLATVSNLGGTFPKYFVLKAVDLFTVATCTPAADISKLKLRDGISPITSSFSCVLEAEKHRCIEGGGTCNITRDGYYITNIVFVIIAAITYWGWIERKALALQALPLRAWRVHEQR